MVKRALLALSVPTLVMGGLAPAPAEAASAVAPATAAAQLARGFSAPSKATSLAQAKRLTVAAPGSMKGYGDKAFPHWRDASTWGWPVAPSNACNARNAALYRDGRAVKVSKTCAILSGTWIDPYTSTVVASKGSIDVDHQVSRANAWRSGANRWTATRRTQFANDPLVLVSVSASANRSKGDKGPDAWKPANKASWCLYAKRYTAIKTKYQLTTTASEKAALVSMLGTCTR